MRNYSLLILGRSTDKRTLDISDVTECWHFMTITALKYFKRLPHVTTHYAHIHHPRRDGYDYSTLPKVDYVLFVGLSETWEEIDKETLRKVTGYKKAVSMMERGIKGMDWSFEFKGDAAGALGKTSISAPYDPEIYKCVPKLPGTVMLDHCCCVYVQCWVHAIEKWLEQYKDEFKVFRQVQFNSEYDEIMPYVTPVPERGLTEYLEATDSIETYIVTHPESYGFSLIDMVARGIRVLTVPGFLGKHYAQFEFETFKDRFELIELLRKPVQVGKINAMKNMLTPYENVIAAIDSKLQQYEVESGLHFIP
jgi:hypothetical protein